MFRETPFGLVWGAVYSALLVAGCVTDLRWRRIPNLLVVVLAAGGLAISFATRPAVAAIAASAVGMLLG
jgi:Flp pilus assembly protein protease CpaA